MFNLISQKDDVPSKRRLGACVKNLIYKINNNILLIKNILPNIIIGFTILLNILYPQNINADNEYQINQNNLNIILSNTNLIINNYNSSPAIAYYKNNTTLEDLKMIKLNYQEERNEKTNYKKLNLWVTAYSSSPDETDDDPFITASGSITRDGIVATNILPFGTKIKIPKLFGDKIFTVEDRMHQRKTNFVDIWMESKQKALNFGIHYTEILILNQETELAKN
ncbi:MAG: 3D domain-containing protein [Patescibacteria group bacterium]|nr:3D domain-containing protein [Patescibacteria group bacterium]